MKTIVKEDQLGAAGGYSEILFRRNISMKNTSVIDGAKVGTGIQNGKRITPKVPG
ncbi:hypothetical protein [Olivibacter jilunii]|uniref:hypothetical protein n=1 Tax=Olivibacter jilunii TaxID=985016 RepID=UPI0013EF35EB|nr:hypothetical protein [Olivibacter jilunii]